MIKPSDAIKDPGLDDYFNKSEKEFEKVLNARRMRDYINYIFMHHVDADSVLKDIEAYKNKMTKEEDFSKHMNKPTAPIKIFYSQPMHDKTEEEIEDKIGSLDNYIYGILRYSDFKAIDINRIEIIGNLHHEGLDADAGRLRHLGASIQLMEDADLIIFDKDWDKAKGCKVEMAIAETYALHKLDAGNVEFPILLSYWFERFLEREKKRKMKINYIFIGELKVNEDLTKNKDLLKKFQEIDGIIFKAKHVFSWDPERMKIIRLIKGTTQSLTNVKQANNWADKTLSNLHYHFPY